MSFKEQMAADVGAVFLNRDEFAREIDLGGVRLEAVAECRVEPAERHDFQINDFAPVNAVVWEIHAATADCPALSPGESTTLDGQEVEVTESADQDGMTRLVLRRFES